MKPRLRLIAGILVVAAVAAGVAYAEWAGGLPVETAEVRTGPVREFIDEQGQTRLPLLIRVRATVAGRNAWPDLVVSPRTEVDESCVLDQNSNYCQGR